ncbi:AAA-like domain-containing protein, partial [Spirulina sp. 06S082]|uniref:AAA-like domain-containing protein n=1 Tax=Spirulina sp. 06S082 TaxID=3110248 RepID=UPI002B1EC56C
MKFGQAELLQIADRLLCDRTGEHLTDIEAIVLQGSWQKKKYEDIASEANFNPDYIRGTIGQELWKKLSDALGERVEKRNFRTTLERHWQDWQTSHPHGLSLVKEKIEIVTNLQELERPQIEQPFYQALSQAGCLVRIKAPWQMGKTALMTKGLNYRKSQGDRIARLSLRLAEASDFASLESFLLWFCTSVTEILAEENQIAQHWQSKLGNNKVKCMTYFEKYLLDDEKHLVIALDDVDRIFPYTQIAGEFLGILRTLHEQAKTRKIWQNLSLLIVHTELYEQLEINQSPFNVGTQISIPEFTSEEVLELATLHGLEWEEEQVNSLRELVGGHPYLVQQSLLDLARGERDFVTLREKAIADADIYGSHLHRYRCYLKQLPPEIIAVFDKIYSSETPLELQSYTEIEQAQKLYHL